MSKRVLAAVLALTVIGVAAALAQGEGQVERGAALYAENCLACHGPQGEARADHEAFAAVIRYDASFVEVVAQGVEGTFMGAWGAAFGGPLSDQDLTDLGAYAQTWGSGQVPALPQPAIPAGLEAMGRGDPNLGAALFLTNCAGCHGPAGEGRGLDGFPALDPEADVLTATRRGAGERMPPFAQVNGGPLSEDNIADIMAYVRTWERPTALQVAAEAAPKGAWQAVLLVGLVAVLAVGGAVLSRRQP